ncbi:MAG TPA: glycosyltransferase family 1 protein [Porticoccus sp.]|nr:glycosyltransferase family 1 protein [Porticoccus sp.]
MMSGPLQGGTSSWHPPPINRQDYRLRAVWINKGTWKKPGPIAYMGLLNALSFAWNGINTDFFVNGPEGTDLNADLTQFYGLEPHPQLAIHLSPKSKSGQRPVYQAGLKAIKSYCEQDEPVLVMTREVGILAELIRLKRRYPQLTVLHEVHDYYGSVKHLPSRGLSDYRRMIAERLSFGGLDGLICLTEYQRALYQQWLPELPMTVQPLGSAKPDHKLNGSSEQRRQQRRIAYIGHLISFKGLALILELAQQLRDQDIEIVCYGGHQGQVDELTAKANSEGLASVLKFVTFLSPRELNEVLATQISIGLVPLQNTYYSRYLTCPVKALDFMANGLPVVGSDLPSVKDVLDNSGVIIASDDATAYAKAVTAILDDEQRYQRLSQQSLDRAEMLSWKNRAKAILDFSKR